jgi:hypothetical protein
MDLKVKHELCPSLAHSVRGSSIYSAGVSSIRDSAGLPWTLLVMLQLGRRALDELSLRNLEQSD